MASPRVVIESGPSAPAKLLAATLHATLRNALKVGSHAPHLPWPYGLVELMARAVPRPFFSQSSTVHLASSTAQLVRAGGVDRSVGRVVLYFHGGGFMTCGPNTHSRIITRLSSYSDSPVLAVDYRMIPQFSVSDAVDDCVDAYWWLRNYYDAGQIVFAGDSAGGYLALATAMEVYLEAGESPAAMTLMSPLLQLDPGPKKRDPNIHSDAMFTGEAFDALAALVKKANGGGMHEPLNWLTPGLPPTLIHVSGSEVLLHDAEVAAHRLTTVGVPVEVHIWPGQMHVFQIAAPLLPEADRSLKQIGAHIVIATRKPVKKDVLNDLTGCTRTVG